VLASAEQVVSSTDNFRFEILEFAVNLIKSLYSSRKQATGLSRFYSATSVVFGLSRFYSATSVVFGLSRFYSATSVVFGLSRFYSATSVVFASDIVPTCCMLVWKGIYTVFQKKRDHFFDDKLN